MKKILLSLALALAAICAAAQSVPDNALSRDIREMPSRAALNTHSYEFGPIYDTPAPKGYKPFYISHYGRHGSRSCSDKSYPKLKKILEPAKADGQLTPGGEMLLEALYKAIEYHAGMDGRLTQRGCREHAKLAERMYKRYPAVFRKGSGKIFAASSIVPRCIISMNSFTNSLKALQGDLDIELDTGENFMDYLSNSQGHVIKEQSQAVLDSLKKTRFVQDTVSFLANIFKDPSQARKYMHRARSMQSYIYDVARTCEAFDMEEDVFSLIPDDVLYLKAQLSNLYIYLRHANSELYGDRRLPRTRPLVDDIIKRADEVVEGRSDRVADLRFGHDWPLCALLCYLGLEGVSERLSIEEAEQRWSSPRYIPFAGNLQMIFYRNRKGDVLVKFLMNEKETAIPSLTPVQGPYYRWKDVKEGLSKGWL